MHYKLICMTCFVLEDKGVKIMRMYFNVVCEEMSIFGGKIIHVDENVSNMDEVHKVVCENIEKFPNGKWELYPCFITINN